MLSIKRLQKYLLIPLMLLFAMVISTRGVLGVWSDVYICILALMLVTSALRLRFSVIGVFLYILLMTIFFTSSMVNQVEDMTFIYYVSIIVAFAIVLNDRHRVYCFIVSWGFINAVVALLVVLSLVGVIDLQGLVYSREGGFRAAGFILNPNYYAYMNFVSFILCSLINFRYRNIVLLLLVIAIILSFSRGVIAGLMVYMFLSYITPKRLLLLLIALVSAGVILYTIPELVPEAVIKTIEYRFQDSSSGNLSGRGDIWVYGFEVWSSSLRYVIFGFGHNNFQIVTGLSNTVHNAFLRTLFEQGVVALLAIIPFIAYQLMRGGGDLSNKKIQCIILGSIFVAWISNDYHLVKETMILLVVTWSVFQKRFH